MSQDTISIELTPRDVLGKKVKHLRTEGTVPAVIHDHGKDSVVVEGNSMSLYKVYKEAGKHHPVTVRVGGKEYLTLIKQADFDPRKRTLSHIVFNAVSKDQKVEAEVPIRPKYAEGNESSPAERASLIVLGSVESVTVEALPANLPDELFYDAEKLVEVGDHITVADLIVPVNVEITDDPNITIASVFEPSALAAANDAAGGDAEEEIAEGDEVNGEANIAEGEVASENKAE